MLKTQFKTKKTFSKLMAKITKLNLSLKGGEKYIGLILIAAITFNFLFLPLTALAAKNESSFVGSIITWFTAKPILFASSLISMLLSAVFGVILYLEAQIIDYIFSPTNFSFTNSPIVTLGWGITRDLANMFFILILLIIAFCTVLKIQSYAIKQLWWKVLVAALLINFSLVIAGFIIDFTQILTTFFIKQAIGDGFLTITTKLMSSMQITNFYNPSLPTSVIQGITDIGPAAVAALVGIVLTLVGLVVTVFVFGAAVIFLIVRILYLWLLLIFAPIVWMLWILPATSTYFSQWWDSFIKWAFFAPIFAFMIYLSLSIFDAAGQLNPKVFGVFPALWKTAAPGLTTISMPAAIFQWILVIAMMFGSLIVAQKFGILPKKLIDATIGTTKGAAKATGLWGIKSYGRMATGLGTAIGGYGAKPGRSPIVRNITFGIGTGLQAIGGVATGAKGGRLTAPLKSTPNNPLIAIKEAAIKGSGLFKKTTAVWECQNQNCNNTIQSKTKPTFPCPNCGALASVANWTQI